ncbi:arsenate reductase ArsC [uncultured Litoreibacter sp.]|uniref:arsenate reductase ArsC n=1 Tax=uncultured Litoreibacter sp. TaxID=1392394 RepID=UPI0026291EC4|nr:arsenate reductase ArsC [uncultured Litoreibacter sp.]
MNILVLCTGNSARSILLEGLLDHHGFQSFSAGSKPAGQVHPWALPTLKRHGISLDEPASKSWDVFAAPDAPIMDLVITVCGNAANEVCPVWPGAPLRAHWGVEDPAAAAPAAQERAFEEAFQILRRRADAFAALAPEARTPEALARIGQLA